MYDKKTLLYVVLHMQSMIFFWGGGGPRGSVVDHAHIFNPMFPYLMS